MNDLSEEAFNEFRGNFNEPNRSITFAQFRALSNQELDQLLQECMPLSYGQRGQARLFHPSSQPQGKSLYNLLII